MLKILRTTQQLENKLDTLVKTGKVLDYRILIKLDMTIEVFIKSKNNYCPELPKNDAVTINIANKNSIKSDPFIEYIFTNGFKDGNKIDFGSVRRFESFDYENNKLLSKRKCPVITFYSYKGGMGRTTTLVSYAIHSALSRGKKVVIIDCDFEAPGYLNFFDLANDSRFGKDESAQISGIVEYFLDSEYSKNANQPIDLDNYYLEIPTEKLTQDKTIGKIYVVPAGNLNDIDNVNHYLQALQRIDLSRADSVIDKFDDFLTNIEKELKLSKDDLILIDSRTGFNDILGVTAFNLSNLIVGFFGSSEQTKPGLHFLLDKYAEIKNQRQIVDLLLINSIVPEEQGKHTDAFDTIVNNHWSYSSVAKPYILPLKRNDDILGYIGVNGSMNKELVDLIKEKSFSFKGIFEQIDSYFKVETIENSNLRDKSIDDLRLTIIEKIKKYFDSIKSANGEFEIYSERKNLTIEYFYFRKCMNLLFNSDYFIISGFKGTGKTLLYKVLSEDESVKDIRNQLYQIDSNNQRNYHFVNAIKLEGDNVFDFRAFYNTLSKKDVDLNEVFRDFWILFTWYQIMLLAESIGFDSSLKHLVSDLAQKTKREKVLLFVDWVNDNSILIDIEKDLKNLNTYLAESANTNLMVLFDHLDDTTAFQIDSTEKWAVFVSPLINFWLRNPYNRITSKIFLRTDLFQSLRGTNTYILNNKTISIEWSRDEVYAYFFKIVLSIAKNEVFELMRKYRSYSDEKIEEIENSIDGHNQIPTEKTLLEPLMITFFGKEVSVRRGKRKLFFGTPYDFFYDNLRNANETISLRAFENYIARAVEQAWEERENDSANLKDYQKSVIHRNHIEDGDIRNRVISDHFVDLTKEPYNKDLEKVRDYFRSHLPPVHIHRELTPKTDLLNDILKIIIEKDGVEKSVEELRKLMEDNGIIVKEKNFYRYAKMYQYWLGLKSDVDVEQVKFDESDYQKVLKTFSDKLIAGNVYEVSIFAALIYQSTRKRLQDYGLTSSDPLIDALEENGCIEILAGNERKCKFLKLPSEVVFGLSTKKQPENNYSSKRATEAIQVETPAVSRTIDNSKKLQNNEIIGQIKLILKNPLGEIWAGFIESELDKYTFFHKTNSSWEGSLNIKNLEVGDNVRFICQKDRSGKLVENTSKTNKVSYFAEIIKPDR